MEVRRCMSGMGGLEVVDRKRRKWVIRTMRMSGTMSSMLTKTTDNGRGGGGAEQLRKTAPSVERRKERMICARTSEVRVETTRSGKVVCANERNGERNEKKKDEKEWGSRAGAGDCCR